MRRLKGLAGALLMALLLSRPQASAFGAARAMAQWAASVAPALFPFLALMPLLTCGEAAAAYERLLGRAMNRLFRLPGAAAPAMVVGMTAGTPAGAIASRDAAARSGMNRGQLARVAMASAGFSPAFLVGGIGCGMLGSASMGWKLLEAQLLTQLTLALLLRRCWMGRTQPVDPGKRDAGEQPIRGAVSALLTICGYMMFFGALSAVIGSYLGRAPADALLCLLDVPSGARRVAALAIPAERKIVLLAAMDGFGGACLAAQGIGALKGCGIPPAEYIGIRLVAAVLSAGYMAALLNMTAGIDAGLVEAVGGHPFALGALLAALMAIPVLAFMRRRET